MTHEIQPSRPQPAASQPSGLRSDISLSEIAGVLWRRKAVFLLIVLACLGLAALASYRMTPRWRADAEMVLVQRDTRSDAAKTSYAAPLIETVDTQMAMLQSVGMAQRTLEWLQSHPDPTGADPTSSAWTTATLEKAITITNPKETDVIQVSTEAASPELAAQVANAVCQAFLQWKKELAQQQVQGIAQSLQVRSARAEAQMRDAERREKLFKQQHQLTDVAAQEKFLLDQYQTQEAQANDLQKEIGAQKARLAALGAHLQTKNVHLENGGGVRDDTLVASLQSQLTQLEMDRADAAQKVTPLYPGILPQLDAKIRDVKARLAQALHGILSGNLVTLQSQGALLNDYQETQVNASDDAAKLAAVNRLRSRMRVQIAQMPQIDADYRQLARNVDLTNTLYSSLQSSLEAARLDADIATGDVQITQAAIASAKPFRPNWAQNLALAGLVGIFLAGLTIILLEQGDRPVRTLADVQRRISAPVLGSLPVLPRAQAAALLTGSGGAKVMEAYRLTYANLLLTLHRSGHAGLLRRPVILVTSARPGEGKTVTARHLARAIARCGKRTILVDADLRPSVPEGRASEEMGMRGLADVLRGTASLEEAIVDSEDRNLLILGRGRVDWGSADLVSLPQMEQTLTALRGLADVIIVDSPACLERADVFFLAPLADCILQVVGAKRVDEEAMGEAFEALTAARPGLMALFFNFSPEHRMTLMAGAAPAPAPPPSVPIGGIPAWDTSEKILLSENRTTKIIVQSFPDQERAVRLAHPSHPD